MPSRRMMMMVMMPALPLMLCLGLTARFAAAEDSKQPGSSNTMPPSAASPQNPGPGLEQVAGGAGEERKPGFPPEMRMEAENAVPFQRPPQPGEENVKADQHSEPPNSLQILLKEKAQQLQSAQNALQKSAVGGWGGSAQPDEVRPGSIDVKLPPLSPQRAQQNEPEDNKENDDKDRTNNNNINNNNNNNNDDNNNNPADKVQAFDKAAQPGEISWMGNPQPQQQANEGVKTSGGGGGGGGGGENHPQQAAAGEKSDLSLPQVKVKIRVKVKPEGSTSDGKNAAPAQSEAESVAASPFNNRSTSSLRTRQALSNMKYATLSAFTVIAGVAVMAMLVLSTLNRRRRRQYNRCRGLSDDSEMRSNFQLVNHDERLGIRHSSNYLM